MFLIPSQISMIEEPFLNINCDHLQRFNPDLYSQLVRYPQEVIPTFDLSTNELFEELYPDTQLEHQIQVRSKVDIDDKLTKLHNKSTTKYQTQLYHIAMVTGSDLQCGQDQEHAHVEP